MKRANGGKKARIDEGMKVREREDKRVRTPGGTNAPSHLLTLLSSYLLVVLALGIAACDSAIGGRYRRPVWKLAAEGWLGRPPRIQGVRVTSARREIVQLLPSLGW